MGIFDKANELKDQAAGAADKAKDLASKVPGGDKVADKIDDVTSKIPGAGDAAEAIEEATE